MADHGDELALVDFQGHVFEDTDLSASGMTGEKLAHMIDDKK
jgi:hypothetical protein